ncbi:MAG: cobaltochelatase subunit CobN, partial [Hyphomicrobiales bacterium]|nr:cobaltochelatase subunit CobN [Hyphomicrobiales bacterium]
MHLLRTEERSLDEAAPAVDLGQTPADLVALSFSDSDLACLASAARDIAPATLRLANLASLRHPYSIDLHVERVCANARGVLVRALGGKDYWPYGVDELARLARERDIALAIVPGDDFADPRLDAASTLPPEDLRAIWRLFRAGGPGPIGEALRLLGRRAGLDLDAAAQTEAPRAG